MPKVKTLSETVKDYFIAVVNFHGGPRNFCSSYSFPASVMRSILRGEPIRSENVKLVDKIILAFNDQTRSITRDDLTIRQASLIYSSSLFKDPKVVLDIPIIEDPKRVANLLKQGSTLVFGYATKTEEGYELIEDFDGKIPCLYWLTPDKNSSIATHRVSSLAAYQSTRTHLAPKGISRNRQVGAGAKWFCRPKTPSEIRAEMTRI